MLRRALVFVSTAQLLACGAGESSLRAHDTEIVGGTPTFDRPEVGWTSFTCTGTLIGPRVVLTAAHCIHDTSETERGEHGTFTIQPKADERHVFTVDLIQNYRSGTGHIDDIALLHLATAVPAAIATPATLAAVRPGADERVTMFGYGCESLPEDSGFGPQRDGTIITSGAFEITTSGERVRKTKLDYRLGDGTANGCPGDSGGPRITRDGRIFEVNSKRTIVPPSGYGDVALGGPDSQADVPAMRARLVETMSAWDAADIGG